MLSGLKFLLNFQSSAEDFFEETASFFVKEKQFKYRRFSPIRPVSGKSVLIFPGFSVYGFEDQRIAKLAKAIVGQGYHVFVPKVACIENLQISEEIIEDMAIIIRHLTGLKRYSESGKIALLAPSFSGGMVLKAVEQGGLQDLVSSICTIGAFANIETCISFVLYQNQSDDYARNVLLKNFIGYTGIPNKDLLQDLLHIAIEDNGFKRQKALLPQKLETIDTEVKQQWFDLHQNIEFRKKVVSELKQNTAVIQHLEQTLNVIDCVDRYSTPVVLIHGKSDEVIPADESVQIFKKRKEKALPSYLCVTDLLTHGDSEVSFSKIKEVWHLAGAFSFFFKYAQ